MELKLTQGRLYTQDLNLLIVPCGIETRKNRWLATGMSPLLIVPCGIETRYRLDRKGTRPELLIVPCGIETLSSDTQGFIMYFF